MARPKDTPRRRRRALARAREKLARERLRLSVHEPGGAPSRAIPIESASLVEPKARSTPCVVCGAEVAIEEHAAEVVDDVRLRIARVRCRECGQRRSIYFRIEDGTLLN